ncbi:MAG TPA: deoxyribonuclease IV [Gemmatimonadaceae bacterium]|nr:deoxyribonuclease IV [Gemmatimonadaceae bacterium]
MARGRRGRQGRRGRRGRRGDRGKTLPNLDDLDTLDTLDHLLLGAHVSTAGGTPNAPGRAKAIGATAMQMFSKQASRWAERVCEEEECRAFVTALSDTSVRATAAHDSYLINLASPDPVLRARSLASFEAELRRCEALGVGYLVSHPGNFMDDRASGLARNAEAIGMALERVPGCVVVLMEMTAGSGTALGATFEEMASLIDAVPMPHRERVAVCVDTAHIFASGYDLVDDYEGVWARFSDTLGMHRLCLLHLNDSKAPRGSHRDRHELIGEGTIGERPFRSIMTDERLVAIPKVIETPKLDDAETTDRRMLERLRSYAV